MIDRYGIVRGDKGEKPTRISILVSEFREFLEQIGCAPDRVESEVARFVRLHGVTELVLIRNRMTDGWTAKGRT